MLLRFVLVGVVLVGCSKRNDTVCCLTAADCESIGLSASDVGNRGCRDGESCIDLTCVPTPALDASNGDAPSDGTSPDVPYVGRCDPSKQFTKITNQPNLHVAYGENHFALSSDELTGYVGRDNNDVFEVSISVRATVSDEFPVDVPDTLAPLASHAFEVFPSRQQHLMYVHARTVPNYRLLSRNATTEPFTDDGEFGLGDSNFPSDNVLRGVSGDASRLYYTGGGSLYQATSLGSYSTFLDIENVTSMAVDAVAISPDELTLYYSTNPATGVFVSTRADKSSIFGPGTQIAVLPSDAKPAAVTADECVLYVLGSYNDATGIFAVTKPH